MKKLKRISQIIVAIFVLNLFSFNTSAQAAEQTPIVGQATASVAQMQKWAKSKGATDTFISLAPKYMELASKHGGINPVVAYAQSAVETGYGKFGGIIDESYHNPCGLKTSKGGDNDDPNAHQRFANWDQGISAHLDHLALYAGANGYPRSNTYDPRHFASIKGKAVYVEQLSGAWATDAQYAGKILNLKSEIEKEKNSIGWIETPSNNSKVNGKIQINGWALDSRGISKVKLFVDNKYIKDINYGINRADVAASHPGYLDNEKSGFEGEIDADDYLAGKHSIKLEVVAKDGISFDLYTNFEVVKKSPKMWLESPRYWDKCKGETKVSGWALNDSGVKQVDLYVNNKFYSNLKYGYLREDVNKSYPGYKNGEKSGFEGMIDFSKLPVNTNIIKVVAIGNDGSKTEQTIEITNNKKSPKMWLESPVYWEKTKNEISINGWALNESGVKNIKVYINDKYIKDLKYGLKREDVNIAYPGYSNGIESGFNGKIDLSGYSNGNYKLKVIAEGNDGSNTEQEIVVTKQKDVSRLWVENPSQGADIQDNLKISGWALDSSGINNIKAYIDGNYVTNINYGYKRYDVNQAYPGYTNGIESGFEKVISVDGFKPGNHKLKIVAISKDGAEFSQELTINVKKKSPNMWIEAPSQFDKVKNSIKVSGWAINDSGTKNAKIYIDNKYIKTIDVNQKRYDVNNIYSNYKGSLESGFETIMNLDNIGTGEHSLIVEAIGNDGSSQKQERKFVINRFASKMWVETPANNEIVKDETFIQGWALNDSGINKVEVYCGGSYLGALNSGLARYDVSVAYPGYKNSENSGFSGKINTKELKSGENRLEVKATGIDGSIQRQFVYVRKNGNGKIVIDPGHRLFGADTGAVSEHNGIVYNEGELDLQLAMKVKNELENKGYDVIMTQTLNNMIAANTILESLQKRVEIAENNKADLFVSIHHNSYDNANAYGTEVWYSNPKKNPQVGATKAGQELAGKVATSIAKEGGFYNRGSKQRELYVTYNTTMPAILVEAGFLTNPNDAKKAASSTNQQKVARGMSNTINTFMQNR
ncbi:N-acetylmuramoyl-L-alanine amidase [Clostridium chrysemydis]|uniref:N-acetylmuramoyl-L-alanine amidase n=1 Tax=Clostridium chrysemydis TaxID=2665504 RepID=UPI00188451CF|nr:N-acetylmuramoyl-L-alanine amidase [Clostridium chrysemydis]